MKLSADWSFHPQEEADWQECLSRARSRREKEVLWQLLGLQSDGFRAMKEIHALDPASNLLPVLLVREVNRTELAANAVDQRWREVDADARRHARELLDFVNRVSLAGNTLKPYAWDLAAGHLHALLDEAPAALKCLYRAATRAPEDSRGPCGPAPDPDKPAVRHAQGLNSLYAGDIERGAATLAAATTSTLPGDPFLVYVRDCHDCDHQAPQARKYTKSQFARRLAELLGDARVRPDQTPRLYYELANGLYNMTYHGNARVMYQTPNGGFAVDSRVHDSARAQAYYAKALQLSRDPELKARACYMAAKCELNSYYDKRDPQKQTADFIAGRYFRMLKDSFAATRYYQEVIRECGYFRTYVSKATSSGSGNRTVRPRRR